MDLKWIHEDPAQWDAGKERIVGGAPDGVFTLPDQTDGDLVAGEWWRVEADGALAGYGWMDTVWGDAEVLLAVDPDRRGQGIGTFIMDRLEEEARKRGLHYLYNVVRPTHPDGEALTKWLIERRFKPADDRQTLRRVVRHGAP